jgi:hypothetical protein
VRQAPAGEQLLAGTPVVQLGEYDDKESEELTSGRLPYAWGEASAKAFGGILLPVQSSF